MSTKQASGYAQIPPEVGIARNDTVAKFALGTVISDTFGNSYRYVKAGTTVAEGMAVTAVAKAAWPTAILVDGTVDATSATNKIHVDAYAADQDANAFAGYWLSVAAAESGNTASNGRAYRIKSHDAVDFSESTEGDVFLEDNLGESWANDTALLIYNPYLIEPVNAATETIMGVAIGAITADSYGFIQVGGHCPAVLCGGTTSAAVVANEPLVPGATVATDTLAGACIGMAGSTETDIMEAANSPLIALQSLAADTAGYVEAFIKGLV
jgi:hypothetical protein